MNSNSVVARVVSVCAFLFCAIANAATELPPPTGPYAVGSILMYAKDDDRAEEWTDDPKDRREIPLFVYYPADADTRASLAEYLPYPPDKIRGRLAVERGRGRVLTTHTYADVPLTKGSERFPVLLFSGGAGASPASYHAIIEDLVSHGYIVVGMDHTYEGGGQILGDGRLVEPTIENFRPEGDPQTEEFAKASRAFYYRRVGVRAADAATVIRLLKMMDSAKRGKFSNRLDLDRIGVFGHSLGGVAAAHALMDVPQIKAGVNLDGHALGMPFDEKHTATKPFLCVEAPSQPPSDENLAKWSITREQYDADMKAMDERQAAAYRTNPTISYRVTINGAEHGSFSDETYPMPEKDGMTLALREKYTKATRCYLLAFFDSTLRGKDVSAMAEIPSELAEIVQIEKFGGLADR